MKLTQERIDYLLEWLEEADYCHLGKWAGNAIDVQQDLDDALSDIAKLEAELAGMQLMETIVRENEQLKEKLRQLETETLKKQLRQAKKARKSWKTELEEGGDGRLLALFVIQDELGDLLPGIHTCSGLSCAINAIRRQIEGGE